ncbi:DJ-1/PfpI family protein [Propionivibrio sp.]|uniref:DJ-1/PfpI family protein n=1 Tax=Propionivibrio sp. TaxID=2212460 RepID=UPI0025E083EE|nr:DJ-1/PfpI family protein [Propionivibrio sp.]
MVGHTVRCRLSGKNAGEQPCVRRCTTLRTTRPTAEKQGHNFTLNASFDSVTAEDYDAGDSRRTGTGISAPQSESDRHGAALCQREKKPIAAICHGAQLLAAAGVLGDRSWSAYPACAAEVTAAGGSFAEIPVDRRRMSVAVR